MRAVQYRESRMVETIPKEPGEGNSDLDRLGIES